VEYTACFWARSSLELRFDFPGEVWAVVFAQDGVCDGGVGVFGVDEEAVDVEYAGADAREAKGVVSVGLGNACARGVLAV
jgi:hypothetical protein